jgi:hypothetical protein
MKIRVLMTIYLFILVVLSPVSDAMWLSKIEGIASEKNEVILHLQFFSKDKKFGVDHGREQRLLFIREKTDCLNYSVISVDCTPEDLFIVREGWLPYYSDNEIIKSWGHFVNIEKDINECNLDLTIRISGDIITYILPFKFNNVDYPFDKYDIDLSMIVFKNNTIDDLSFPFYKGKLIDSNYELENFIFLSSGTYQIHGGDYYGTIYETNNLQIKRTLFQTTLIGIFLWIMIYLLIAIFYMVQKGEESGKVIRLYMGFFVPSLFVFGFIQNIGSLATTPLIIFGSILLISTLLLCVNILIPKEENNRRSKQQEKEKDKYRKNVIYIIFSIWLVATILLLLFSSCNILGYAVEWVLDGYVSIITTTLFIALILSFIFKPPRGTEIKKRYQKFHGKNVKKLKSWLKKP